MSNALTVQGVRDTLEQRAENIFAAAASHVSQQRMIEMAARCCIQNPKLLECRPVSIVSAVAEAASLGLELGGVLGHAYMVPYKGVATLVPGYLGLKELAYRSDRIAVIDADVVRPGDFFEYQKGTEQFLRHRPGDEVDGNWTHVYAIAKLAHGEWKVDVMSFKQVEHHKQKYARGYDRNDSAWRTAPEAMAKKTVLRRLYKLLPLSAEVQHLVQRDEYVEHGVGDAASLQSGDTLPTDDLDALSEGGPVEQSELFDDFPTPEEAAALDAKAIAES